MSKMNSLDRRFRDERDLRELLELCDKAITSAQAYAPDGYCEDWRKQYDALIARRAAEDEGRATV